MGQKIASLEIELGMATGTAVSEIQRFGGTVDAVSAQAIRDLDRIDVAMKSVGGLDEATASAVRLADETARSALQMARDAERSERAGERMVAQLERQIAVYGLTRSEVRALRAEEAALAAERNNQHELAGRIRAREADLYASEFADARKARQAADAAAEDVAMAAEKAIHAKEREAQAVRDAAFAYQQFERVAREGAAAWKAEEAARARAVAEAAVNAQLLERSRLEAALSRTMGTDRPRATDAGATWSALAEKAAEDEARAQRTVAAATEAAAREHASLAAAVRGSHAAQMADAEAAEQLRLATDSTYAATKRLNDQIEESNRLYRAGATAPAEYARQQEVLGTRLRAVGQAHNDVDQVMRKNSSTMMQLSFQLNDVATMAAMGAAPFQIFASQAGQIFQIAQMAEGGVKGFAAEIGSLTLRFAPLGVAAATAGVMLYALNDRMENGSGLKEYAAGLGLAKDEMKKLGDVSVTTGDMMRGFFKTIGVDLGDVGSTIKGWVVDIGEFFGNVMKGIGASIYGLFVGSYRAIIETWHQFPAALGDLFVQAVNGAIGSIEWMGNKIVDLLNWLGADFGKVALGRMKNDFAGSASDMGEAWSRNLNGAVKEGLDGVDRFMGDWTKNSQQAARDRLKADADKIKADRTPKVDRHAEQLARDAAAIEAQIRNLYSLADAYRISGAEALIAEARVKAESKAIRQRGDVEAAVAREVRLAVAQRVVDAAKGTAGMRDQAAMQERINKEVADGNIVAEQAGDIMKARIADLPLLAALEAAQRVGDLTGAKAAQVALDEQRAARDRLTQAERKAQTLTALSQGEDRLAMIREEIRLIGADEEARTRALAVLKAEQEARAAGRDGSDGARWVKQQGDIASLELQRQLRTDAFNASLSYQADLLDALATNAEAAGRGLADAFGEAGRALGDTTALFARYIADQERLNTARDRELEKSAQIADVNARAADQRRINSLYDARTMTRQIGLYGDMAVAARGFFKEGSDGYKALTTATQVFRAIEFALSVRSMAQDAAETASSIAKSGARAVAHGVEAVAKAIASLPFPANLAAGAATAAALAAIGVSIVGAISGGGNNLPEANTGTGTVLGDRDGQSESIRRGLDALREVDLLMLNSSRDMANSLRSIESQIGGVASLIVRAGDVNADVKVNEGFQKNLIGSVLSKIPLIGGFLGGLFGSKTEVVGGGLYAKPQNLGSILDGGFDASYYSDTKKTSKFLGITTGTSYKTSYTGADAGLENQFALILRDFNSAIVAAAEPLGAATGDIEARLRGFVVDIGKIDLKGLSGEQIQERLTAVFGAAADRMAGAAFPGMERFQKVGEGLFETLVRVASTVEATTASFEAMGRSGIGVDASVALVGLFDSISDFTSAQAGYFEAFYSEAEQAAARQAQMERALSSLGVKLPATLAGFRALVDAQDLMTAAGRQTYATLIQLAPAFAELQSALGGAKSAADIAAERRDLERRLLELSGDTAALRALDLAGLDASNRGLQKQVWAVEAAQEAAKKAEELRKAWASVGDGIMDEVRRIRGLDNARGPAGFAALMGQFNAVSAAARAGDMDAAKQLPSLSRSLLDAAEKAATSRQELDRVQAEAAASLEATYAAIAAMGSGSSDDAQMKTAEVMTQAATAAASAASSSSALVDAVRDLKAEVASLRSDNNAGHAGTAREAAKTAKVLERAAGATGGTALAVASAA